MEGDSGGGHEDRHIGQNEEYVILKEGWRKKRDLGIYLVGTSTMSEFTPALGEEALSCITSLTA